MKKAGSLLLAALLLAGTLTGCGKTPQDSSPSGKTPVVLNEVAHSIFYAPMYVAIEEGYFADEGIELTLITGFGADKTMTALLTGEADIGFMGSESTIYTYKEGASDYAVNFAQLTQRAGNFLVSREPIENFSWDMLIGKDVLGGRAGGMPEMVFEYILKKNGIDPANDLSIDQSIDFGSTAAAFSGGQGDFSVLYAFYYTINKLKERWQVPLFLIPYSGFSLSFFPLRNSAIFLFASSMSLHPSTIISIICNMPSNCLSVITSTMSFPPFFTRFTCLI